MKKMAIWYFDIISPYAYLQCKQLQSLDKQLDIQPVPVLFAGLLNHWGQLGPAEIEPKRRFIFRQCAWRAARENIPFCMPPSHPFNPLWGLRLICGLDNALPAVHAVFDHLWAEGRGLIEDDDRATLAAKLGLSLAEADTLCQRADVKQALNDNTERAVQQNVFGVPSLLLEDQLFWGEDSRDMLQDWLSGDLDFDSELMRQIDSTQATARRPH